MTLIHAALLCEAIPIIERFKLQKISKNEYRNENVILLISGIGKKNTLRCLNNFLSTTHVKKAINIGIAGCKDESIKIGEIFSVNCICEGLEKKSLTSVLKPTQNITTTLVDMEAEFFSSVCEKYEVEYLIFKVVSDYLDDTIPKKEFVSSLIRKSMDKWIKLI